MSINCYICAFKTYVMLQFNIRKVDPEAWIAQIETIRQRICGCSSSEEFRFYFDDDIDITYLKPWHIVSLACLFDYAISSDDRNVRVFSNDEIANFFDDDLHLSQYFKDIPYIEAETKQIMNLWKVEAAQSYAYSNSLTRYLKREYFKGKDLTAFNNALNELYANVADHAHAAGVAYSYIRYDEARRAIGVAFCDFGVGIPTSLREAMQIPPEGMGFVEHSMRPGVSARSSTHNAGLGLDDVLSLIRDSDKTFRVVSNREIYINSISENGREQQTSLLDFCFNGTLIDFELDVSGFEDEEIIGESDLFGDIDW